jgi:hypothetical protein
MCILLFNQFAQQFEYIVGELRIDALESDLENSLRVVFSKGFKKQLERERLFIVPAVLLHDVDQGLMTSTEEGQGGSVEGGLYPLCGLALSLLLQDPARLLILLVGLKVYFQGFCHFLLFGSQNCFLFLIQV